MNSQYFNLPLTGSTLSVGTPYSQALLVAGGGNSYTFTPVTPLPPGLSIDFNTGVVSGTPTQSGSVFPQILITDATDANVKITATFNFAVTGPPAVVTLPATNVGSAGTPFSATLNGTVNPGGFPTTGFYEWGTTVAYGNTTSVRDFGSGLNSSNHTVGLTGLSCVAGTVFHYRLTATNSVGTRTGVDQTFTCSPQAFTNNADNIGAFTARLNGVVNPNGLATQGWYQWGLTSAYTNFTPFQSVGAGTNFVSINGGTLTGLACNTTYHFRAVASNANGTRSAPTRRSRRCPARRKRSRACRRHRPDQRDTARSGIQTAVTTTGHFQWGASTGYGNIDTRINRWDAGFTHATMAAVPDLGADVRHHLSRPRRGYQLVRPLERVRPGVHDRAVRRHADQGDGIRHEAMGSPT